VVLVVLEKMSQLLMLDLVVAVAVVGIGAVVAVVAVVVLSMAVVAVEADTFVLVRTLPMVIWNLVFLIEFLVDTDTVCLPNTIPIM
jgi:cell shape-determining protein MreD